MSIKVKLLSAAGALVLAGTVAGVAGTAGAVTPPPIDVSNSTIRCNTISGLLKFSAKLVVGGASANTITPITKLYGCSSSTAGVSIKQGLGTGTLTTANNNCTGLQGLSTATSGTLNVDWTVNPGAAKLIPTVVVGTATKSRTSLTINQTNGTTLQPWTSGGGANQASYGYFQVGTDAGHGGTAAPSVSGEFTGGNGGSSMNLDIATNWSGDKILADCFGAGIATLQIGLGTTGNQ